MKDVFDNHYEATGEFRAPKKGEYYFSPVFTSVQMAWGDWYQDFPESYRVIVRRLPG